jgi:ABC-2 type transport system ATP-binding protein
VYGLSPQKDRNKIRELVGVQLQESALPPRLKVGEAVRLFASFYSNPLDPDELLESLGIKQFENSAFKSLSGGQKQRLSIALALVGNPKLAILDELTTGLDPEARRETWSLIERLRDRGLTVILVTHFMDEAEKLCDRLALITHGTVRALDTPEAIAAKAGGSRVRFIPSQPVDEQTLRAIPGVNEIEQILPFVVSLLLSIAEIFALGLVLVALMPSQTVASAVSGVVVFVLMFLSGLWVQPAQVGDPLRTIMYYSPSGAAARALLDAVFNGSPSYAALLTMAVYTVMFGFIAIRYFRWE